MTVRLHRGDLPDLSHYRGGAVAVDTETMGLDPHRDRLCVVQISPGDGSADVIQIPAGAREAPNLTKLLADGTSLKIFHFARFDLAVLYKRLGVMPSPVYCTKIASRSRVSVLAVTQFPRKRTTCAGLTSRGRQLECAARPAPRWRNW